ncbi:MAG: hypothetical protein ACFB21_03580, partial [Opitutales bacterium]
MSRPGAATERSGGMDWPTIFMRNGHLLVLTVALIFAAGWSSLNNMPRLEDPVITTRNAIIVTIAPGSTAERVEALVAQPLEDRLLEVP